MHLTMPEKQARGKKGRLFFLVAPLLVFAALYWWQESGKLFFEARFARPLSPLVAARQGRLLSLEAREGQSVRQGQVLARFDDAASRLRVLEDSQALAGLARTLPPEYLRLPAAPDSDGREESLGQRERRRRQTEEEARKRLEAAADREAGAAVLLSRARVRAASGGTGAEQLTAAEASLEAARAEMRAAREEFERLSLSRAESSADIRRLKELQLHSGASRVPVESRLAAYEQARVKLAESEAELAAAVIRAPHDGRVTTVYVRAGEEIAAGARILDIMPEHAPGFFEGRVAAEQAAKMRAGQRCRLELADGRATVMEGVVHSLSEVPADREKTHEAAVLVRVLPLSAAPGAPWPEEGARAGVTVLLRELADDLQGAQPVSENQEKRPATDGPEAASAEAPGKVTGKVVTGETGREARGASFPLPERQGAAHDALYDAMHGQSHDPEYGSGPGLAVPPPQPLSVQNPFGGENPHARPASPAPSVGPSPSVRPAPPSVIVPGVSTGAALPDTGNNPSLVRQRDLGDRP